jgi:hypothetical protein
MGDKMFIVYIVLLRHKYTREEWTEKIFMYKENAEEYMQVCTLNDDYEFVMEPFPITDWDLDVEVLDA